MQNANSTKTASEDLKEATDHEEDIATKAGATEAPPEPDNPSERKPAI